MENEHRAVRLAVSHGPDLLFDGKLVGESSAWMTASWSLG